MCGIAGLLDLAGRGVDPATLERDGAAIRHRGPDDSGVYVDGTLGLANVRLAVIDTSPAGHQPMGSADGRYVLVYNGELYNYRELAAELGQRAHRSPPGATRRSFSAPTRSGARHCLNRFNGMFAFAIWDTREREPLRRSRPARDQAAVLRGVRRNVRFRLRGQGTDRGRLPGAGVASRVWPSTSPSRTPSPTRRSSRECGCCRPVTSFGCARRRPARADALLGPRVRARRVSVCTEDGSRASEAHSRGRSPASS